MGRIQFRGPSTTSGYLRNPEASRLLFDDDWLESGDLGYVAGGELFITGRVKDLIIRGGRNVYPYELEQAAGEVAGVRRGCVAVFGCEDRESGTERLVVVAETREKSPEAREAITTAIEDAAIRHLGSPPDEVRLVPPYTVLKTSSGKIRRRAVRELFEQERLGVGSAPALPVQILRLGRSAVLPQLRRARGAGSRRPGPAGSGWRSGWRRWWRGRSRRSAALPGARGPAAPAGEGAARAHRSAPPGRRRRGQRERTGTGVRLQTREAT